MVAGVEGLAYTDWCGSGTWGLSNGFIIIKKGGKSVWSMWDNGIVHNGIGHKVKGVSGVGVVGSGGASELGFTGSWGVVIRRGMDEWNI